MDLFNISADPRPRKIIRRDEVLQMTGLSKTRLYELIDDGFPCQVPLGARAVGWYEDEVQAWIRERGELGARPSSRKDSRPKHEETSKAQTDGDTVASEDAGGAKKGRRRPLREVATTSKVAKAGVQSQHTPVSTMLERIGTTSDGREMLWDRSTGNVLVVIGHMPANCAS